MNNQRDCFAWSMKARAGRSDTRWRRNDGWMHVNINPSTASIISYRVDKSSTMSVPIFRSVSKLRFGEECSGHKAALVLAYAATSDDPLRTVGCNSSSLLAVVRNNLLLMDGAENPIARIIELSGRSEGISRNLSQDRASLFFFFCQCTHHRPNGSGQPFLKTRLPQENFRLTDLDTRQTDVTEGKRYEVVLPWTFPPLNLIRPTCPSF